MNNDQGIMNFEGKKIMFPKIDFCRWDYIAILICSIPAFYLLGTPAIYIWDEAVYVNASLDISQGHHWWVPAQDLYNTKPPLVLWMQAVFLKLIPWPEWGVRLPSALAVTGIMIMMVFALKRWGYSQWTRILVLVCFIGNEGFIRHHIGRTGDLDSVMSFFVLGYILIVLDALHFKRWTRRHLILFFIMIVFAFYAKSIAGLIMLGPLGVIWLLSPMKKVLLTKSFLLGSFLSILICSFYYLTRESIQDGFIQLAWKSEYLRMFSNVMPWHEHGFGYYFKNFVSLQTYNPWIFILMGSMVFILYFLKEKPIKEDLLRWMIISLGYMIFISIPADKLEWYDAPVYPFFAMILGVTAGYFTEYIPRPWRILWMIPIVFIFWRKLNFIKHDIQPRDPLEYEGAILRQIQDLDSIKVFMPVATSEHRLQLDFYRKSILEKTGKDIKVLDRVDDISINDHIIICQQENLKKIEEKYLVDTINTWPNLGYQIGILHYR